MNPIDENVDIEKSMYLVLDKAGKNGIKENLTSLSTKTIELYIKRFGCKDYAESIPEEEFTEQLIDCVGHLVKRNDECKKVFDIFNTEYEQSLIIAMISGLMMEV
jgi:hypothetical protein